MKRIKSIHFVGIKGVGVAPLAIIAKEAGFSVSGSDIEDEFITTDSLMRAKIKPLVGFLEEHVQNAGANNERRFFINGLHHKSFFKSKQSC